MSYVFAYVYVFVCMCISMSSFVWFYGFLMHFFKQVNVQLSGSKLEAHCADGVNVVDSTNDYQVVVSIFISPQSEKVD